MSTIWSSSGSYVDCAFTSEAEFEAAVVQVQTELFGSRRIYLDVKKKIGVKGVQENIPDGYLLDIASSTPRLYVVENELAAHEPLRHIAVQILQFSLAFEAEPRKVRSVLHHALGLQSDQKEACEKYLVEHGYRNLDHFLDSLVHDAPFAALVVIDQVPDNLERVLMDRFKFPVEVLHLGRYRSAKGEFVFEFEPFLADVSADLEASASAGEGTAVPIDAIDTVVVPAREEGFQETFLGENRWYAVRIAGALWPQLKYIAAYRVAPTSAISHLARIDSIVPWSDGSGKCVLNFAGPAEELQRSVPLLKSGRVNAPQNLRYTTLARLKAAKTLDDIW